MVCIFMVRNKIGIKQSAALDLHVLEVGNHADAWPAVGFHLVEVFHAGEVSSHVGSSGFGGLLAGGIGSSHIVHTHDLLGLGAVVGGGDGGNGSENTDQESFHFCCFVIIMTSNSRPTQIGYKIYQNTPEIWKIVAQNRIHRGTPPIFFPSYF